MYHEWYIFKYIEDFSRSVDVSFLQNLLSTSTSSFLCRLQTSKVRHLGQILGLWLEGKTIEQKKQVSLGQQGLGAVYTALKWTHSYNTNFNCSRIFFPIFLSRYSGNGDHKPVYGDIIFLCVFSVLKKLLYIVFMHCCSSSIAVHPQEQMWNQNNPG